ncbi:MAG: metal-dependent transcriptional regulator [Microscillaceae bacterium]|nr:metal-dependent transcriptional regulator [Microscillaceae bacterium]MDW8461496.1 metal-dependent transcriptional regulator [Cytophagales bacterium]
MIKLSLNEEDYLKTIYQISVKQGRSEVSTNEIAKRISLSAASVSDMLKKLAQKELIHYVKYQGVSLTQEGKNIAIDLVRKHRLWETFLVEKLGFSWDEVHEIAEQLEHIQSDKLIERLDEFLGFPAFDPHGDAIPNSRGELIERRKKNLSQIPENQIVKVVAVEENSATFLKHLNKIDIQIGTVIKVLEKADYDKSVEIEMQTTGKRQNISKEIAENLYVVQYVTQKEHEN